MLSTDNHHLLDLVFKRLDGKHSLTVDGFVMLGFYHAAWNAMRSYDEISVRPSVCLSVCQMRAL